jgi:hypothetical protein
MGDHQYEDVFVDGDDLWRPSVPTNPCRTAASSSTATTTRLRRILATARRRRSSTSPKVWRADPAPARKGLRNRHNKVTPKDSACIWWPTPWAGLICRAFLQNPKLGSAEARTAVDKVFTYATPHNGIDLRIVRNVPGWLSFGDVNNFNRERMAKYLAVPKGDDVSIVKNFPPERIFNLVGTNPRDYTVGGGISAWAAGDASDGLVRIENATTHGPGPTARM